MDNQELRIAGSQKLQEIREEEVDLDQLLTRAIMKAQRLEHRHKLLRLLAVALAAGSGLLLALYATH
ncbi:MAG: hypothetical protein KDE20_25200 [Caldilineaceae bacterium]|nr:hypothetical protein [Caldilineaceae bacterium]